MIRRYNYFALEKYASRDVSKENAVMKLEKDVFHANHDLAKGRG
jgi:hypothetical protein